MCGICGSYDFLSGRAPDPAVLGAMNATLIHRGPDGDGMHLDGPAGIAARRLAIIDLEHGDQPMLAADGAVCVAQNGEILNHLELRRELESRGARFRTQCDTEVLLHLYLHHGPGFVSRLRGMFAFAIWDRRERRLLLARDRFGIKPLYYRIDAGRISFASELKALLQEPNFPREVDREALHSYLAFNSIPAPLTIFRAARKLPPGHVLTCSPAGATIERYARPAPAPEGATREEALEVLAEELRERMLDSVRAHLLADVPVGVLLSGGIDSSVLTALAARAAGRRVSTFSIGFQEPTFNELDLARQVDAVTAPITTNWWCRPGSRSCCRDLAAAFDEPFADSSAIPTYLVSELAARHVKVVLSGEGGDELFGGTRRTSPTSWPCGSGAVAASAASSCRSPSQLRRAGEPRLPRETVRAGRGAAPARAPPRLEGDLLSASGDASSCSPMAGPRGRPAQRPGGQRLRETEGAPLLARLQDVDLGVYLADDLLVKTDRMSMTHGLEARVPYLDPVVAELALALPTELKVRGLQKKRLLRAAARPLIPASITRARKRGFSIPAAAWLRGELEPLARELLGPARTRAQGYFEPDAVTRLLDDHVARRRDNSRQLWGLMCFSLWAEHRMRAGEVAAR